MDTTIIHKRNHKGPLSFDSSITQVIMNCLDGQLEGIVVTPNPINTINILDTYQKREVHYDFEIDMERLMLFITIDEYSFFSTLNSHNFLYLVD